jgi:hypothetical protein
VPGSCAAAAVGATRSGVAPAGSGGGAAWRAVVRGGAAVFVGGTAEAVANAGGAGRDDGMAHWLLAVAGRRWPVVLASGSLRQGLTTGC